MNDLDRMHMLQRPAGPIDVVLDTDTYNEIDDQFALAYLLSAQEKLHTLAITAAPFLNKRAQSAADGMEKSYQEILKLLRLMDREADAAMVFRGSDRFLPDEQTPVDSPAARRIAELALAHDGDHPLYVAASGAITNVASALLLHPEIAGRMVVVWLGGHALHYAHTREFNMKQDIASARVVFQSGVPLVLLPCRGVVDVFTLSGPDLEKWFIGANPLCDYLAKNAIAEAESYAAGKPWTRVIWDVTAVAWLLDPESRFLQDRLLPRPVPEYDGLWGTDIQAPLCRYVYHVNRDALAADLAARLTGRTL